MPRSSKKRIRSRPDKEVRTVDVPLEACTDVVRQVLAAELKGRVEEPTIGYFTWSEGRGLRRVRYTLRTYADTSSTHPATRLTLEARGDLGGSPALLLLLAALLVATAGLGLLLVLPFLGGPASERRREIAMFRLLRVLEQSLTPSPGSYRVAAGALPRVQAAEVRHDAALGELAAEVAEVRPARRRAAAH